MSSKNNNKNNQGGDNLNNITPDENQGLINLNEVNTNFVTPDELEETYLYFINDKIKKNECIYSPRPPKKNINSNTKSNNVRSSANLRNYKGGNYLDTILNKPPKSLVFNKTMIISPLKPILEEPIETYNTRPERHFSLPNIKFENISNNSNTNNSNTNNSNTNNKDNKKIETDYSNIKLPKLSKSLKLYSSSTLDTINELSVIKKFNNNYHNNTNNNYNTNNSFKDLSKGNDTTINKDGHYTFKSNYRLKKYLVTLHSNNFNVNNIVEKYFCKRMSLSQDTEEWIWYNLKYQFSFTVKYNIDNYGHTFNYSVFIKYSNNKVFNIDNLLMSGNVSHLDKEMKSLFIKILEGNIKHYWQLSSIQYNKNTKYISYALLAPLQYYRLYLQKLKNNIDDNKYNKFIEQLFYYGNIDINDEQLQNNLKNTLYYD